MNKSYCKQTMESFVETFASLRYGLDVIEISRDVVEYHFDNLYEIN